MLSIQRIALPRYHITAANVMAHGFMFNGCRTTGSRSLSAHSIPTDSSRGTYPRWTPPRPISEVVIPTIALLPRYNRRCVTLGKATRFIPLSSRASLNSRAERFNGRMSATSVQRSVLPTDIEDSPAGVNNFTIVAATVNGSGSQTANNCLLRALFKMGIPVSGKNIFPSNIQGLPTWFSIRVSKDGYIARRETSEIVVAMNRKTAAEDIANVPAGGVVI